MKKQLTLALCAMAFSAVASASDRVYNVTITNITKGQTFTPVLAVAHNPAVKLFRLGRPASDGLAALAESGNVAPLTEELNSRPKLVGDTNASQGLLAPGSRTTITLKAPRSATHASLAAMLIPTNDAFVGMDSVRLPRKGSRTVLLRAYDAGSETNDEICANIPGPVCQGTGPSPDDNGEGYVHIGAGISGEGDLAQSAYDWGDRVALVRITRVDSKK